MKPNANNDVSCDADTGVKAKRNLFHAIIRFIIPLTMLVWGISVNQTNDAFDRNSKSISAELTSSPVKQIKSRPSDVGGSLYNDYRVEYRFSVDGKTYTGQGKIKSASNGLWALVYYDVGNPANNRTELPGRNEGGVWICLAILLGIVMCPLFWRGPTQV
jgi:hypothetical protein